MQPITDRPRRRTSAPPHPARRRPSAGIVLAGMHGGIGISTLAALLAPARDIGAVSDRFPEPTEATHKFRVHQGRADTVARVPFIPAFRVAADPSQAGLPRRARRAVAEIRATSREQAPSAAPAT